MPDMDGKELSERILALRPGLKCLYMSGYTEDVIARQGILERGREVRQQAVHREGSGGQGEGSAGICTLANLVTGIVFS